MSGTGYPSNQTGAAYSPTDLQEPGPDLLLDLASDPTLSDPRPTREGRYSVESVWIPYVYGSSDPDLRPVV